jgi:hypothetical protein
MLNSRHVSAFGTETIPQYKISADVLFLENVILYLATKYAAEFRWIKLPYEITK